MTCIIVDDEPLAREGLQLLIAATKDLDLLAGFSNAAAASKLLLTDRVDLLFLDIQMPGINGIEFARTVPTKTLVIFTTAFTEYAIDSYEVEAIDYLVKPIKPERFQRAVAKAFSYQQLLHADTAAGNIESVSDDYIFIKSERKVFKVQFKDILFIEGLKDYVIVHTEDQRIITAMNIKTIHDQLPRGIFVRISKSYVINVQHIASFDNNTVFVRKFEIPIGSAYRAYFFDEFVAKRILSR
ncbi:LytR/AlgR family response regulator transcription factor [Dinghuibacter silviterrae]|uniref:LytTR family two component transcriptional regulator n=1 Tax=Dinghuibacter silviterrae TaxID=1539049 RepID=A0A4R8DQ67_9BACT|nr:LytTR family DNA-binding domain-containing protein [Dinghuibacter silviterrae]TDW99915.1 LytTR family two component transcriptional regulator [Dinghuibacter silviterrae]